MRRGSGEDEIGLNMRGDSGSYVSGIWAFNIPSTLFLYELEGSTIKRSHHLPTLIYEYKPGIMSFQKIRALYCNVHRVKKKV